MKHLLVTAFIAVVVLVGVVLSAAQDPAIADAPKSAAELLSTSGRTLVIAHRGFSADAPENTIPAMRAAVAAKADMVEIDVQRTRDGHLVVLHDKTLARTTDVSKVFPHRAHDPVGSFSLAEIRHLDAGSWKGPAFVGTRVPTLGELLTYLGTTPAGLILELKNPSLYPGFEKQVADELHRHGFDQGRTLVHSFSASALRTFHASAPGVPVGLIVKHRISGISKGAWFQAINPPYRKVTARAVTAARTDHLDVFAWTKKGLDTPRQIERLVHENVTGIITDRPDLARFIVTVIFTTATEETR